METTMIEKWINELQCEIDKVKRALANAGGEDVTITPALESGTKVADYSIGETTGALYAPTPPDAVTITPALESGTKVADYTIGSASGVLYAPEGGGLEFNAGTPVKIGKYVNGQTEEDVYMKIVEGGAASGEGAKSVSSGITNISKLLMISASALTAASSQYYQNNFVTIPTTNSSVDGIYDIYGVKMDKSSGNISYYLRSGLNLTGTRFVIIYTQTVAKATTKTKARTTK